jgi:hypothetical protein
MIFAAGWKLEGGCLIRFAPSGSRRSENCGRHVSGEARTQKARREFQAVSAAQSSTKVTVGGGREAVMRHVTWFREAVDSFRFFNLVIHPLVDPEGAAAEVEAQGIIKSTGRVYRQNFCVRPAAKSYFSASISNPCLRPKRRSFPSFVLNPKGIRFPTSQVRVNEQQLFA